MAKSKKTINEKFVSAINKDALKKALQDPKARCELERIFAKVR